MILCFNLQGTRLLPKRGAAQTAELRLTPAKKYISPIWNSEDTGDEWLLLTMSKPQLTQKQPLLSPILKARFNSNKKNYL
jgi:hypothetical protein